MSSTRIEIGEIVDNTLKLKDDITLKEVKLYFENFEGKVLPFDNVFDKSENNISTKGDYLLVRNNCFYSIYVDYDGVIHNTRLFATCGEFKIDPLIEIFNLDCFKFVPSGYPIVIPANNNFDKDLVGFGSSIYGDILEFEEGTRYIKQNTFRGARKFRTIIFPSTIEDIPDYLFDHLSLSTLRVHENNPYYFDIDGKMIVRRKDMCLIKACRDVKFIPDIIKKIGPRAFSLCGDEKRNPELIFEGDIQYMGYNALAYSKYSCINFLSKSYPLTDKIVYNFKAQTIKNCDTDIFRVQGDAIIPTIIGYCYNDILEKSDPELIESYATYVQYYFDDIKACIKTVPFAEFVKKHIDKFSEKFIDKIKKLTQKGYYKNIDLYNYLSQYTGPYNDETINDDKAKLMEKYIIVNKYGYDTIVRYIGREKEITLPIPSEEYNFKFNDDVFAAKKRLEIAQITIPSGIEDVYFSLSPDRNIIDKIIVEDGIKRISEKLFSSHFRLLSLPRTLNEIYPCNSESFMYSILCTNNVAKIEFANGNNRYCVNSFTTNQYTQYYLIDKRNNEIIYYPNLWENRCSCYKLDLHFKVPASLPYKILERDLSKVERAFNTDDLFRD